MKQQTFRNHPGNMESGMYAPIKKPAIAEKIAIKEAKVDSLLINEQIKIVSNVEVIDDRERMAIIMIKSANEITNSPITNK